MIYALILVATTSMTGVVVGKYPTYASCQFAITKKFPHKKSICVRLP